MVLPSYWSQRYIQLRTCMWSLLEALRLSLLKGSSEAFYLQGL